MKAAAIGVALAIAISGAACSRDRGSDPIVSDDAALLSEEQRAWMERYHQLLLDDHDLDYRVVLVRDVGDVDRYAHARFEGLEVGSRSAGAKGLLLVLDAGRDVVRLEVGGSLEGAFPDAFVAYVEQRQMVPYFRAGQVGQGVLAATELLVTRIQNAKRNGAWEEEPWAAGSTGGGAHARAGLGQGEDRSFASGADVEAGDSPQETVRAYLAAMAARNGNPELDLYTMDTRAMLGGRVLAPAQMDNVARAYRHCAAGTLRLGDDGRRGVVRYAIERRECAPFLLEREDGRWRIDFATAAHAIRFGRSNAWHLVHGQEGPYAFAFEDWTFDRHGYPIAAAPTGG